jgi:hypothetical protein
VAGQQRAHVLDADVALDHRLAEVAEGGGADDGQPVDGPEQRGGAEQGREEDRARDRAGQQRAGEALPRLLRRDGGRHRVLAEQHAGHVPADVAADDDRDERRHPAGAVRGHGQQRGEAGQERHVGRREGRRRDVAQEALRRSAIRQAQAGQHRQDQREEQRLGTVAVGQCHGQRAADHERQHRRPAPSRRSDLTISYVRSSRPPRPRR